MTGERSRQIEQGNTLLLRSPPGGHAATDRPNPAPRHGNTVACTPRTILARTGVNPLRRGFCWMPASTSLILWRCAALLTAASLVGCFAYGRAHRDVDRSPTVDTGVGATILYPGESPVRPGGRIPQTRPGSEATTPDPCHRYRMAHLICWRKTKLVEIIRTDICGITIV